MKTSMQTIISIGITPYIIGTVESSSDNVAILDISNGGKYADNNYPFRAFVYPLPVPSRDRYRDGENVDHVWPENLADAQVVLNSYTSRYPSQTAIITNSDSKQIIADACLKLMGGSISADEFVKMASAF